MFSYALSRILREKNAKQRKSWRILENRQYLFIEYLLKQSTMFAVINHGLCDLYEEKIEREREKEV